MTCEVGVEMGGLNLRALLAMERAVAVVRMASGRVPLMVLAAGW